MIVNTSKYVSLHAWCTTASRVQHVMIMDNKMKIGYSSIQVENIQNSRLGSSLNKPINLIKPVLSPDAISCIFPALGFI